MVIWQGGSPTLLGRGYAWVPQKETLHDDELVNNSLTAFDDRKGVVSYVNPPRAFRTSRDLLDTWQIASNWLIGRHMILALGKERASNWTLYDISPWQRASHWPIGRHMILALATEHPIGP